MHSAASSGQSVPGLRRFAFDFAARTHAPQCIPVGEIKDKDTRCWDDAEPVFVGNTVCTPP
eukprot:1112650-Rhodomonas_salina.3